MKDVEDDRIAVVEMNRLLKIILSLVVVQLQESRIKDIIMFILLTHNAQMLKHGLKRNIKRIYCTDITEIYWAYTYTV